jgi:hypothetical protein
MRTLAFWAALLVGCSGSVSTPSNPPPDDQSPAAPDAGTTSVAPPSVTEGALTVAPSSTACGAWLPQSISTPTTLPSSTSWLAVYTDGAGAIAATHFVPSLGPQAPVNITIFPGAGGAARDFGSDSDPIPQPVGFVWTNTERGPCMVCDTALYTWPSTDRSFYTGDGYPWHGWCDWIVKPDGGLAASCQTAPFMGSGARPSKLWELDQGLAVLSQSDALPSEPAMIAADRAGAIVVSTDAGQRWIDGQGQPVSGTLEADATASFPLIGGGLLTKDDRVIASGSSNVTQAPGFLKGRASEAAVVLGERAYAFTSGCTAQIASASGEACGSVSVQGCKSLRFGVDGSAITSFGDGTWQVWTGLLR